MAWHHALPEHLVQVAIEEGDEVQVELLQVRQVQELGRELGDAVLLLFGGCVWQHVDAPEQQQGQAAHPGQVQHKPSQSSQIPGAINLQVLDTVQLHHLQDPPEILHRHGGDPQLLAAQVQQVPPVWPSSAGS